MFSQSFIYCLNQNLDRNIMQNNLAIYEAPCKSIIRNNNASQGAKVACLSNLPYSWVNLYLHFIITHGFIIAHFIIAHS